jgi:hypothetical protein
MFAAPSVTGPKGGATIRVMVERFAANPVYGASSLTVPIAVSPGRSGLEPELTLSCDSSASNYRCHSVGIQLSTHENFCRDEKGHGDIHEPQNAGI